MRTPALSSGEGLRTRDERWGLMDDALKSLKPWVTFAGVCAERYCCEESSMVMLTKLY
jgi:hypothetical protein